MVVIYSEAPISVLTDLQDFLVNNGADYTGNWDVEVKLYRANQASFKDDAKQKSLFTVWGSHEKDKVWILLKENGVAMTLPIKEILDTKLQSLWTTRQVFKGSGHSYICSDGSAIRITNIFVQGSYKGLLLNAEPGGQSQELCKKIGDSYEIPEAEWTKEPETEARQYLSVYK